MSSHCVSTCLLVLLGALMTSGASFQYISERLNSNHKHVAQVLKLTQPDLISDPLFNSVIWRDNSSCQGQRRDDVQLMSTTLDIYGHIFSNVLNQKQQPDQEPLGPGWSQDEEKALQNLQQRLEGLREHLSQMNQERERVMAHLKSIKADDATVQRKALAQFKEIYQAASLMVYCGHAPSPSSD